MTDTATARFGARQQSQGSNVNTWGDDKLNEVLRLLDRGAKGVQSLAMTGDTTLSWTNYVATNDGQCAVLLLTGSLSAAANLVVPSREWVWDVIKNSTGQAVTVKTAVGAGVAIPNGRYMQVFCDGSDCYNGTPSQIQSASTIAGALTVAGQISGVASGTLATDAVNKTQMETAIATATFPATAGTILVDSGDATAGYIAQKIVDGVGADLTITGSPGNASLVLSVDTTELEEFLAVTGKLTDTITSGTTAMTDRRRYKITGGIGTLPVMTAGSFVIVEFAPSVGVTATIGRNTQSIDGEAEDDTYTGDGGTGPIIRYAFESSGVVTTRSLEGSPV